MLSTSNVNLYKEMNSEHNVLNSFIISKFSRLDLQYNHRNTTPPPELELWEMKSILSFTSKSSVTRCGCSTGYGYISESN